MASWRDRAEIVPMAGSSAMPAAEPAQPFIDDIGVVDIAPAQPAPSVNWRERAEVVQAEPVIAETRIMVNPVKKNFFQRIDSNP